MYLEALDETRVVHEGREYIFEERAIFGYVYNVADALGEKAVATRKCRQIVVDEDHPYAGPTPETEPMHSLVGEGP